MAITAFKRREVKFLLNRSQLETLLPVLSEHMLPDKYCRDGRFYEIHNVYYDTPDSALIRASLAKPYHKEKLRLRSYTAPAGPEDQVFLELKKKTGGIVHKRRAVMTLAEAQAFIGTGIPPAAEGYMNGQVERELSYFLELYSLRPAVYIGYRRMAFFGKDDPQLRITFDDRIITRRQSPSLASQGVGELLLGEDQVLMEVKLPSFAPLWLAQLLTSLGIYKTSFSKYGWEYQRLCSSRSSAPSPLAQPEKLRPAAGYPSKRRESVC